MIRDREKFSLQNPEEYSHLNVESCGLERFLTNPRPPGSATLQLQGLAVSFALFDFEVSRLSLSERGRIQDFATMSRINLLTPEPTDSQLTVALPSSPLKTFRNSSTPPPTPK